MSLFGSRKMGFFGGASSGGSSGSVSGTGTTNYLSLWSGATTIIDSRILDDTSNGIFAFKNSGVNDGLIFNFSTNSYTFGINGNSSGLRATNNLTSIGDFNSDSNGLNININNNANRIRTSIDNNNNGLNIDFPNDLYQFGNWNPSVAGNNNAVLTFDNNVMKFTFDNGSSQQMYVENGIWSIGDVFAYYDGFSLQSSGDGILYTTAFNSNVGFYMLNSQSIKFGSDNNGTYIDVNDNTQIAQTSINGNVGDGFKVDFIGVKTNLGFDTGTQYIELDSVNAWTMFKTQTFTLNDNGTGSLILNDSGVIQVSPYLPINIDGTQYYIPLWTTA
jgi:hypothetical protein